MIVSRVLDFLREVCDARDNQRSLCLTPVRYLCHFVDPPLRVTYGDPRYGIFLIQSTVVPPSGYNATPSRVLTRSQLHLRSTLRWSSFRHHLVKVGVPSVRSTISGDPPDKGGPEGGGCRPPRQGSKSGVKSGGRRPPYRGGPGGVLPPGGGGKRGVFDLKKGGPGCPKKGHFGAILEGKKGGPRGVKKPGNPAPGRGGGRGGKIGKIRGHFCTAGKSLTRKNRVSGHFPVPTGRVIKYPRKCTPPAPPRGQKCPPAGAPGPPLFYPQKGGFSSPPSPPRNGPTDPPVRGGLGGLFSGVRGVKMTPFLRGPIHPHRGVGIASTASTAKDSGPN